MDHPKKWHAVYTRPRWEKKVHMLLEEKGLESYCPLNKVCRQWSDRRKIVLEPLFTSYVFVHITSLDYVNIKKTDGVVNLVYWLGSPAVIRDEEIETIKQFLGTYENVQLEKAQVCVNDSVRITSGPFMDMEGVVVEVMHHSIKVILPSLGYAMIAPITKVRVLKENNNPYKVAL